MPRRCPLPARNPLLPGVLLLALGMGAPALADAPRVVVSIAPVHSLVAAVTGDVASPHLIVPPGQSPHTFSLAPSDARALARADAVFTAGGATDRFLERPLRTLADDAQHVSLLSAPGVRQLPARSGGAWRDGHHRHEDEDEDAHGHEDTRGQAENHGQGENPGHDPDAHTEGASAGVDPHAWLDPRNAMAFVDTVAARLADLDPARAERYRANAAATAERLAALDREIERELAPLAERPYLVFHDAYQYFERRYRLAAAGSVVVDPGRPPGARRLSELRDRIRREGIECLFVEPQFEPRIAQSIAEGTGVRIGELDPLGAGLQTGTKLYPELLERLADALRDCLDARTP